MLGASFAATRMYVLTKIPPPRPPDGMIFLVLCFSTSAHQAFNESTHTHDARTKNKNKNKQLQLNTRGGSSACIYLSPVEPVASCRPRGTTSLSLWWGVGAVVLVFLSLSRRRCPSDDVVTCPWADTHTHVVRTTEARGAGEGAGGEEGALPPPRPPPRLQATRAGVRTARGQDMQSILQAHAIPLRRHKKSHHPVLRHAY